MSRFGQRGKRAAKAIVSKYFGCALRTHLLTIAL
jgi:hypothetical protein